MTSGGGRCSGVPPGRRDKRCYWLLAPSLCGTPALPTPGLGPGITPDSPVSSRPGLFLFPFTAGRGRGSFGRLSQGRPSRSHSWPGVEAASEPGLAGSPAPWTFPHAGCPRVRNATFGGFVSNLGPAGQPTDTHTLVGPSTLWGPLSDHQPLSPVGTEVRTPSGAETSEKATVL